MKKRINILFVFLAVMPIMVGCDTFTSGDGKKTVSKDKIIVAKVDDRKVTLKEFEEYLKRINKIEGQGNPVQLKNVKREYLLRYIERVIFLKEAINLAVNVTDEEILEDIGKIMKEYPEDHSPKFDWVNDPAWKEEIRAQLMIKKLIRQQVHNKIKITTADLKEYYKTHKEEFNRQEMVRVRQIVVDTEKEANKIRKQLLSGKSFIKLAKKFSRSPDREKGGDLGFFTRGQMPVEFDEAAFSLKKINRISQVFRSDYGYHIFQLVGKRRAKKLKFNEVKDKIHKILKEQRESEEFSRWFSNLKKQTDIKINTSFL
jgi:peptidyl-prolyl cis-trans isomerase C